MGRLGGLLPHHALRSGPLGRRGVTSCCRLTGAARPLNQASNRHGETFMKRRSYVLVVSLFTLATLGIAQDRREPSARAQERITREVRHELLMLPYFGVFDNIAFKVNGYDVTLLGQVVRPSLKSDAEGVVKRIEGVEKVDNQ